MSSELVSKVTVRCLSKTWAKFNENERFRNIIGRSEPNGSKEVLDASEDELDRC